MALKQEKLQVEPKVFKQFINGKWVESASGETFPDYDPFTGEIFAAVPASIRADADRAVEAAAAAFPAWAALPPIEKQKLFLRMADIIERRLPELMGLLAAETGACRPFAMSQIPWTINLLRQAASWGYRSIGDVLPSDHSGKFAMAVRKPLGVVAGITPWNGAHILAWRTSLLPMVFGNTVVLKPSEEAPVMAGLMLAEIAEEAKLPPGVLNIVTHAPGKAKTIADAFFESPHVRCINFTGSTATGRILAERAGKHLKRIVLELGGLNPLVVLRDADVQQAVDATVFGAFLHQGQICLNTRKVIVEKPIADAFLEKLAARASALKIGDPKQPDTVIGPLISDQAAKTVRERVDEAVAAGARLVTGGKNQGRMFPPTVLADVPSHCMVFKEETFGPVLVVETADSADEALGKASSTSYGLCAGLFTGNQEKGLALAEKLDCGIVHVNGPTMHAEPSLPNGGVKDSGWGRSGLYSIEDFTEVRLMTLARGTPRYPI